MTFGWLLRDCWLLLVFIATTSRPASGRAAVPSQEQQVKLPKDPVVGKLAKEWLQAPVTNSVSAPAGSAQAQLHAEAKLQALQARLHSQGGTHRASSSGAAQGLLAPLQVNPSTEGSSMPELRLDSTSGHEPVTPPKLVYQVQASEHDTAGLYQQTSLDANAKLGSYRQLLLPALLAFLIGWALWMTSDILSSPVSKQMAAGRILRSTVKSELIGRDSKGEADGKLQPGVASCIIAWVISIIVLTVFVPTALWYQSPLQRRGPLPTGIGLPFKPWRTVGLELEMQPLKSKPLTFVDASLNIRGALATAVASKGLAANKYRMSQLRSLGQLMTKEEGLTRLDWSFIEETDPGLLYELVGPMLGSEEEVDFAVSVSDQLSQYFEGGNFAGLHVTVDSKCLLAGHGEGLIALLLIWEHYHSALARTFAHRPSIAVYAHPLADKHPTLLAYLQDRWEQGSQSQKEDLPAAFRRLASSMKGATGPLVDAPERDGYRNFAVNVCHLLPVDCCWECEKNHVTKHGGLEFRLFDFTHGRKLRSAITVAERLVQSLCSMPPKPDLRPLLALPGILPATDISPLLAFLQINETEFHMTPDW